ncbi:hypothetical protein J3R82DRAFT_10462 [Butyriboletus roseoflavus]|nr:hypothetical protein J3R82DRAFT_10462 [Butyriboletus roseoflavus]
MFRHFCGLFRFLKRPKSSSPSTEIGRQGESRNIVILGSLGVGKSSLVNMLTGRAVARVSSDIGVAHPAIVEYPISFSEISGDTSSHLQPPCSDPMLRFYDTLGLEHRPSPWGAIKARLKRSGGADVVVYCMRRGRLSNEQVAHLRTIRKTFCRGNVPLVLVVIGVDYRRGSTEEWWEANGEDLINAVQVDFTDHICLNTWDSAHPSWKHQGARYEETQRLVRHLVIRHCRSLHSDS